MSLNGHPVEDIESCSECHKQRVIGDGWLNDDGVCELCATTTIATNILAVPTDRERLAKRKAIKDGTAPFRKSNKPRKVNCDLPFTVDLDTLEKEKLNGAIDK